MSPIDLDQLQAWEKKLAEEVVSLRERQRTLDSELKRRERELELIRQMLSLDQPVKGNVDPPKQQGELGRATSITVKQSVRHVLLQADRPLHISEIYNEFLRQGYPIPGSRTPFNILVHIVKDPGFIRVARGTYALQTGTETKSGTPIGERQTLPRKRKKRKARP